MSGIITGPHFIKYFNAPGPIELGTMVAVLEIGAFCLSLFVSNMDSFTPPLGTSLAAGSVGDIVGRKGTLCIGAAIFTIGGVIQTWTLGFWSMVAGRVVSGVGVGLLS